MRRRLQQAAAATARLVGGAIVHGGAGLVAGLLEPGSCPRELAAYVAIGVVSALTSGPVGSLVLTAAHHAGQLVPAEGLLAGATGLGVLAGGLAVVGSASLLVYATCCGGLGRAHEDEEALC